MVKYLKLLLNLILIIKLNQAKEMQGHCLTEWPAIGTPEGT